MPIRLLGSRGLFFKINTLQKSGYLPNMSVRKCKKGHMKELRHDTICEQLVKILLVYLMIITKCCLTINK